MLEAGVGHDRVEATEALERRVDGGAVALACREVGLEAVLQVDPEHTPPVRLQPRRHGAADPAGRARDDRDSLSR